MDATRYSEFLKEQAALSFFVPKGAHLITTDLGHGSKLVRYSIESKDGYVFRHGLITEPEFDFVLRVLAEVYGKSSISYLYWYDMIHELETPYINDND